MSSTVVPVPLSAAAGYNIFTHLFRVHFDFISGIFLIVKPKISLPQLNSKNARFSEKIVVKFRGTKRSRYKQEITEADARR